MERQCRRLHWHFVHHEAVGLFDAVAVAHAPREGIIERPFDSRESADQREPQPGTSRGKRSYATFAQTTFPDDSDSGMWCKQSAKIVANSFPNKYPSELPSIFVDAIRTTLMIKHPEMSKAEILAYEERISQSLSKNSWNRYVAGWKSYAKFLTEEGKRFSWPVNELQLQSYVAWADRSAHISPATIKAYISALSKVQQLLGFNAINVHDDPIIVAYLKGMENAKLYSGKRPIRHTAITFDILKVLGHQIRLCDWTVDSKTVIWAAALVAFWGSFRLGEILSPSPMAFNFYETLLWSDVTFRPDGSVMIHLKSTKTKTFPGQIVDLFPFHIETCCPVKALKKLFSLLPQTAGRFIPVFKFSNGKNLTSQIFMDTVKNLLQSLQIDTSALTGHSFRAGIPSLLATAHDSDTVTAIQTWGRWTSDAYKTYLRLRTEQRRHVFHKIASLFPNSR